MPGPLHLFLKKNVSRECSRFTKFSGIFPAFLSLPGSGLLVWFMKCLPHNPGPLLLALLCSFPFPTACVPAGGGSRGGGFFFWTPAFANERLEGRRRGTTPAMLLAVPWGLSLGTIALSGTPPTSGLVSSKPSDHSGLFPFVLSSPHLWTVEPLPRLCQPWPSAHGQAEHFLSPFQMTQQMAGMNFYGANGVMSYGQSMSGGNGQAANQTLSPQMWK